MHAVISGILHPAAHQEVIHGTATPGFISK